MGKNIQISTFVLLSAILVFSGCASSSQKRINSLQAQIGVLTEELVRLDQSVQEVHGTLQAKESSYNELSEKLSVAEDLGAQGVYRTPSGFTLPSLSIQQALKNAGYYQGKLDGKIGSGTKAAVREFQRDNGLEVDGVVGRKTWEKLKAYNNVK